jgi:uncharacterized protein
MYLAIFVVAALVALTVFVRWLEPRLAFFPFPGESETPRDFGVAYEPLTIATKDGERLRAWLMPAPAPRARIVYFHGNGGNLSNWSPILAGIARRGYSVLAVDYRGYGVSTGRPSESGLYRDAEAVVTRVWREADNRAPLVYWGRSLGSTVAAYAATVRRPDAVIIEAGFPDGRSVVRGSPLAVLSLLGSYRFSTAEFMNRANVPVLVLHGDRDSVIPFELGRELYQRIQGSSKELVVIAGGDHNDAVARDEQAYWSAIDRFTGRFRR